MLQTSIIKRLSPEMKNKRILRIKEALSFPMGDKTHKKRTYISKEKDLIAYFEKPGKEYSRNNNPNINDMTPVVEGLNIASFSEIWKELLELSIILNPDTYKKLFTIIYRLAYLLDCKEINGQVRFQPAGEILEEINNIQQEINSKGKKLNILKFLTLLDLIGWNEDVKYQANLSFKPVRKGRINNILSMISIPLIFKNFITEVITNAHNLENIDFTTLIDMAQQFARTRGIAPISNKDLVDHLSPFLIE